MPKIIRQSSPDKNHSASFLLPSAFFASPGRTENLCEPKKSRITIECLVNRDGNFVYKDWGDPEAEEPAAYDLNELLALLEKDLAQSRITQKSRSMKKET